MQLAIWPQGPGIREARCTVIAGGPCTPQSTRTRPVVLCRAACDSFMGCAVPGCLWQLHGDAPSWH
eukprot:scaffold67052_cov27-Tisochrysis_lutea.AAC.3